MDRRVAIDRERSFIYFRIPKAANSVVCYRLVREKFPEVVSASEAKRKFFKAQDMSQDEVSNLCERFFLFSFVRNPYSRVASAYLDKVVRVQGKQAHIVGKMIGKDIDKISFLDFCTFVCNGGLYLDPHWFPQVVFIPVGVSRLDFLGKVESLDYDYNSLCDVMFWRKRQVEARNEEWSPHHLTKADDRLDDLYCDESEEIVRSLYGKDFDEFSYDKERG